MDKLSELFEKYKMNPIDAAAQSSTWFNQQVALVGRTRIQPTLLMRTREETQKVGRIVPGSMYVFNYDPLHADTLQYYDTYPLVIPFRAVKGGFYGLNLHYLHPQLRAKLLAKLMMFATDKQLDDSSRLKFTWQTASAAAKNKFIEPCVKHYLSAQVQSQFIKILPDYWASALFLPVESFVGATKQQVWKESRRIR